MMTLLLKITDRISAVTTDCSKIRMVPLSSLHYDGEFKGLFTQEPGKIAHIAEDMKANGFDRSQPILITKDSTVPDGNSRCQTALKAGIRTVPAAVREFENKNEALITGTGSS